MPRSHEGGTPFVFLVPRVSGGRLLTVTYYDPAIRAITEFVRQGGKVA